jgi:hypothetical protein
MHGEIPPPPIFDLVDFHLTEVEPGEVSGEFQPFEFHDYPMGGAPGAHRTSPAASTLLQGASVLCCETLAQPSSFRTDPSSSASQRTSTTSPWASSSTQARRSAVSPAERSSSTNQRLVRTYRTLPDDKNLAITWLGA